MNRLNRRRIGTVVSAPVAALAAWALVRLAGIDLVTKYGVGTVGAGDVIGAALLGAFAAWIVVLALERYSARPRARWPLAGSTGLALSMIGPGWLADGGSAVALMGLHFVTGAVVIWGFAPTIRFCRGAAPRAVADSAH